MSQKKSRKNRKKSSLKTDEHHLEKWLENTSNFNVDENHIGMKEGWPFNASNAAAKQQQRSTNRRKDQTQHQPFGVVNDAILFVSLKQASEKTTQHTFFSSNKFYFSVCSHHTSE